MPGNTPILLWPTPLGGDPIRTSDDTIRAALAAAEASLIVGNDTRTAADLPERYPKCTSLMQLSTAGADAGAWPYGSGAILTMRRAGGDIAWQMYLSGSIAAGPNARMRIGSANGWSEWQRIIAAGLAKAEASGTVSTTTGTDNAHSIIDVAFPSGRFTSAPTVTISLADTNSAQPFWVVADNVTETGFKAHFYRAVAGPMKANWHAVGGIG